MSGREISNPSTDPPLDLPEDACATYTGPSKLPAPPKNKPKEASFDEATSDATMARVPLKDPTESISASWNTLTLTSSGGEIPPGLHVENISGYKTLQIIGHGGVGEVWEAEQLSLGRIVAIKRIREDLRRSDDASSTASHRLNLFHREAKTAAHLDHPNILPVYDLGMDQEKNPVIAMKLISGTAWSQLLREDFDRLPQEDFIHRHLSIFMDVVQAVAFAHSRGIVHRDIKPSQVMVGEFGEVQLIDWGLAFTVDPISLPEMWRPAKVVLEPNAHVANNPAGTSAYMAPEQTEATAVNLGPWTDMFLLGGTLYNMLTGSTPYSGLTSRQAFARATLGQMEPIRQAAAGRAIPEELIQLTEELLVLDWKQRKLTATALIARLNDYQSGSAKKQEAYELASSVKLVLQNKLSDYTEYTRLLTKLERSLTLWPANPEVPRLQEEIHRRYAETALRNSDLVLARIQTDAIIKKAEREVLIEAIHAEERQLAKRDQQRRFAIAGVLLLTACSLTAAGFAWREKSKADVARLSAENNRELAIREQYFAAVGYADASIESLNIRKAREVLQSAPTDWRSWEWRYLNGRTQLFSEDITAPSQLLCADWSPDGQTLALGGEFSNANLYKLETKTFIPLIGHTDKIYGVEFSKDGSQLLTTSKDKTARLWNSQTAEPLRTFEGHSDFVYTAEFHPSLPLVLTSSRDTTLRIWNIEGEESRELKGHTEMVFAARFSPDGEQIASVSRDRTLRIWSTDSGELLRTLSTSNRRGITDVRYSPDGALLLTSSWDADAKLYDAATLEEKTTFRLHTDSLFRSIFSRDGKRIVTFSHDSSFALWDVETYRLMGRYAGHEGAVWDGVFDPTGERLLTAGYDAKAYIWDVSRIDATPTILSEKPTPEDWKNNAKVSVYYSDDSSFASLDDSWENEYGARLVRSGGQNIVVTNAAFSFAPEGRKRIRRGQPGNVIDTTSNAVVAKLSDEKVLASAFSPNGRYLFAAFESGAGLYNTADWARKPIPETGRPIHYAWFSNDSSLMALARWDATQKVTDVEVYETADMSLLLKHSGVYSIIDALVFSPDNSSITFGAQQGWGIHRINISTGNSEGTFTGHTNKIMSLLYTRDGTRLFSVALDSSIRVWDAASLREILVMKEKSIDQYVGISLTSDEQNLVAPSVYGEVFVFEAYRDEE